MAELVRRLPRHRYEPVLALLGEENAYPHLLPPDQPRYVLRPGAPVRRTLRSWLDAERPDIVHSFMERSNLWSRLIAPSVGRPVIVTSVRGPLMAVRYRLIEALLARRSDAVVVNSIGIRNELVRWQRVPASKVRVVPNIVDLDRFRPAGEDVRERVRRDLDLTGTTFLIPGRVSLVKDPTAPVLAARLLARRGKLPADVTFLMAGRLDNALALSAVAAIGRRCGLERQFRYIGPRADIVDLLAACDWVLLPSFSEGLSNAALEAHACAKPLVLSRGANPDGILEDGVTGYEFRTGRFWSLADAIENALATPSTAAAEMGRLGQARVRRLFDPDAAFGAMLGLYEELLAARRVAVQVPRRSGPASRT